LHHRDVVGVALRRLQQDLETGQRDRVVEDLKKEMKS
jgi:hypothetical protein